jgi:hypothetical protein
MGVPRSNASPRLRLTLGLLVLALCEAGCRSAAPKSAAGNALPPSMPSQTIVAPPSAGDNLPPEAPAAPPGGSELLVPPPTGSQPTARPETVKVIEPPIEPGTASTPTLVEAANREKARRRGSDQPIAVITQKNLAEYASGGVLTIAHDAAESGSDEQAVQQAEKAQETAATEEAYWRKRALDVRTKWRDAVDRVPALQAKVDELRNRFYSTDDPVVRDGEVKPEWDRAIADLQQAQYDASRGAAEVEAFMEEGRRAGALPGWLREGAELEPEPVLEKAEQEPTEPFDAREPEIYDNEDEPSADEPESSDPPPRR